MHLVDDIHPHFHLRRRINGVVPQVADVSTPLLDAASISSTSMQEPESMALQASQTLQGLPWSGFRQLTAFARILAQLVLPVPLEPVNRYAWLIFPVMIWFQGLRHRHLPGNVVKVWGRYLRYNADKPTLCFSFLQKSIASLKSHPAHNKIAHPHLNKANTRT